ncbi:MAG: ATP-binding protein [Nitrospirota bacterium]
MLSKEIIKEVIVSNGEFIGRHVRGIVPREGVRLPGELKKTVVFYGVRRSGKTFILYDIFLKHREHAFYADFEDDRLKGFDLKDFERLNDAVGELRPDLIGKKKVFLFDEIQNVEGWERFCRRLVERENTEVFVSGSSSRVMPAEIHTVLRGRSWSMEVLPFSYREFLVARGFDSSGKGGFFGEKRAQAKGYFTEYLKWGGLPEVASLKSELDKTKLIREYLHALYFRDLVERYAITNIPLFETLLDQLFASFGVKFSLTAFYKNYRQRLPFSKDLLFRYYKHFIESMLVCEVRKFAESAYARARNPAKIYLFDTGLCRRVTSEDRGRLLENAVFLELRRKGHEIFFHEEKRECDFIARLSDRGFSPVQVCYELNEKNRKREIGGMTEACRRLGLKRGLMLTYDDEEGLQADGIEITVMPVWKWLLL